VFTMSDLRRTISQLAADFAANVLKALHGASLSDLSSLSAPGGNTARPRPTKKRGRPSSSVAKVSVDAIVETLKKNPTGLRNEQLQKALGASNDALSQPLKSALDSKVVKKRGQRRGTTYFAS